MNRPNAKLSTLLTAAVILASCNNDESLPSAPEGQVEITTRVSAGNQTATEGAYKPAEGTPIYLYYATMGNNDPKCRGEFTYTGGQWQNTGSLFWDDLEKNADNKYPFFAASPRTPDAAPAVLADQNTTATGANADNYALSDQLIAYTYVLERKAMLNLNFRHVLAQMKVVIESPAGDTQVDLSGITLKVDGARTAYTLSYTGEGKDKDGKPVSVPCEEVPAMATATGNAVTVIPNTRDRSAGSATEAARATFVAILPPQDCTPTLTFTIGEKSYTYKGDATTLAAGKTTAYKLNVSKSGVTLQDITLQPWDETVKATEAGIKVELTGTASGAGDGKEDIKGDAMSIWKKTDAGAEADKTSAHAYSKGSDNNWSSNSPIYVDDTDLDNDRFYATIVNATDGKTGVEDLIGAGPARMGKGELNFGFSHLMAQLAVNVRTADNSPVSIDLTDATVQTPGMQTAYTLEYAADNSLKVTATGEKTAYTGLETGIITDATTPTVGGETTYLVVPQTLSSGAEFTVTLKEDGRTYTGQLSSEMILQPGKKNVLNLTLNATALTVGSITLAEWGTETLNDGNVKGDGIDIKDTDLKGIDQAGILYLAATADGASAVADNGSGIYPVTYNRTAGINEDKNAGYAPIIWDNLTKFKAGSSDLQEYTYAALFVPDGYRHGATDGDGNNHEKDYLAATSAATAWGTQPDFSTDATPLKHAMAQLTVKLVSATENGFTADELKGATVTTVSSRSVNVNTAEAKLSFSDANKTVNLKADGSGATAFSALIAPQTLGQVVISIKGNSYTLKRDLELKENQAYSLEITVGRTPLGFSADVTGWKTETMNPGNVSVDE